MTDKPVWADGATLTDAFLTFLREELADRAALRRAHDTYAAEMEARELEMADNVFRYF